MGFAEFLVIAIVGLLVVGPDKLPETIKNGIVWFGRIKRVLSQTRQEFEQQLGVDDIRREIHNEEVLASLRALKVAKQDLQEQSKGATESVKETVDAVRKEIREDFEPEDEGLFGDQSANHPPAKTAPNDASHSESPSIQPPADKPQ